MNGEDRAEVGLSILLIGANSTSNITTGDSVGAILRGIGQANRISLTDCERQGVETCRVTAQRLKQETIKTGNGKRSQPRDRTDTR